MSLSNVVYLEFCQSHTTSKSPIPAHGASGEISQCLEIWIQTQLESLNTLMDVMDAWESLGQSFPCPCHTKYQ